MSSSNKNKVALIRVFSNEPFSSLVGVIKLLPTGTLFAYQLLIPLLIGIGGGGGGGGGGQCGTINKVSSAILLLVCGLLCVLDTFTDSYKDKNGNTHYGIATSDGFRPLFDGGADDPTTDLSVFKITVGDYVHAFLALVVFVSSALMNQETVDCFYSTLENEKKVLLRILPAVFGLASCVVFYLRPARRNYIGYHASSSI